MYFEETLRSLRSDEKKSGSAGSGRCAFADESPLRERVWDGGECKEEKLDMGLESVCFVPAVNFRRHFRGCDAEHACAFLHVHSKDTSVFF